MTKKFEDKVSIYQSIFHKPVKVKKQKRNKINFKPVPDSLTEVNHKQSIRNVKIEDPTEQKRNKINPKPAPDSQTGVDQEQSIRNVIIERPPHNTSLPTVDI